MKQGDVEHHNDTTWLTWPISEIRCKIAQNQFELRVGEHLNDSDIRYY